MKKQTVLALIISAMGVAFVFAPVYATQQAGDTIVMDSAVFGTHTKALVTFTHKKHSVDHKLPCTDCHHTYKEGKNVWKEGDEVQKCTACHSEARASKAKGGEPELSQREEIKKYYYSAIHENCVGCHKDLKKEAKPAGPTVCKDCHAKKQ
jgi:hypothetical protein